MSITLVTPGAPQAEFLASVRSDQLDSLRGVPSSVAMQALRFSLSMGRACTYQSMGADLDVMPRQVAYILSQLNDGEKLAYPWFRVVSSDASPGAPMSNPDGASQAELLREEGIIVSRNGIASSFQRAFITAEELPSGLARQRRPADAPPSTRRRVARRKP